MKIETFIEILKVVVVNVEKFCDSWVMQVEIWTLRFALAPDDTGVCACSCNCPSLVVIVCDSSRDWLELTYSRNTSQKHYRS